MLNHCKTKAIFISSEKNNELEEIIYEIKNEIKSLEHVIVVGDRCKKKKAYHLLFY